MSGRREAELDGVLHVEGECCGYGELICRICGTRNHMQGAYNGHMLLCEGCPENQRDWFPRGHFKTDEMVGEAGSLVEGEIFDPSREEP